MQKHLPAVKVLVVDDTPEVLEMVVEMLEQHGAVVTAVATAAEALEILKIERPDVLVSDLEMPEKDGCWLIGRVRALPPEEGGLTPAACLTGRTEPEARARVLQAGFQYHIPKPIRMDRLVGVVGILALKP
ncbi:MAG TPA: response regulator [Candidatus Limnocylindrales bacterium]|nr:response regulator [Candidatus Limnocylindrales bacterium]